MQEKGFKQLSFLFHDKSLFGFSEWNIEFSKKPAMRVSCLEKYKKNVEEAIKTNKTFADCCIELIICIQQDAKIRLDKQEDISHFVRFIFHLILVYSTQSLPEDEADWINCLSSCQKNIPTVNFLETFLSLCFILLETDEKRQIYSKKYNIIDAEKPELTDEQLIALLDNLLGEELYQNKAQLILFLNALLPDNQCIEGKRFFFSLLQRSIEKAKLSDNECNQLSDAAKLFFFHERKIKILTEVQNLRAKINDIMVKTDLFAYYSVEIKTISLKETLLKTVDTFLAAQSSEWSVTDYSKGCEIIDNLAKELEKFSNGLLELIAQQQKEETEFQQKCKATYQAHSEWYRSRIPGIQEFLKHDVHQKYKFFDSYYCDLAIQVDNENKTELLASIGQLEQIINSTDLDSLHKQETIISDIEERLEFLQSFDALAGNLQWLIEKKTKQASECISANLLEKYRSPIELNRCLQTSSSLVAIADSTVFSPEEKIGLFEQFTQANLYGRDVVPEKEAFMRQVIQNHDIELANLLLNSLKQTGPIPVDANVIKGLMSLSKEFDEKQKENQDAFRKLHNQCNNYFSAAESTRLCQKRLFKIEKEGFLKLVGDFKSKFSMDKWQNITKQSEEIALLWKQQRKRLENEKKLNAYKKDFFEKGHFAEQRKIIHDYSSWFKAICQLNKDTETRIDRILQELQSTFEQNARKIYGEVQEEYNKTNKIRNSLLEDASQIDERARDQLNAINQLLYPNDPNNNLIQSIDDATQALGAMHKKLEDLRKESNVEGSNNQNYLKILEDVNKLLKQKQLEYARQEKEFLFEFICWLGDWVNWFIFSWILAYKAKYDTLKQVVEELNGLKIQFETLNHGSLTVEAELNILQGIENAFDQKKYINLLIEEDLKPLETYLGKRFQLLDDKQTLTSKIIQLTNLCDQVGPLQKSLLEFSNTKAELDKKAEEESKKLVEYEKTLSDLDRQIKTTAAEKNANYYIKEYSEKFRHPLPFSSVLSDKGLTDSEKKACVDALIKLKPELLSEIDDQDNSALHLAVENNQYDIARAMVLAKPELISFRNKMDNTPVSLAFKLAKPEFVEIFLEQKLSPSQVKQLQEEFLHAIEQGNVGAVKLFLQHRIQLLNLNNSHIHQALRFQQEEIFNLLIKQVHPIDHFFEETVEKNGKPIKNKITLLMLAIRTGSYFAIDYLLENSKKYINHEDSFGNNALKIAVAKNQSDIVRKLVRVGAKEASHDHLLKLSEAQSNDEVVLWLLVAEVQLIRLGSFLYQGSLSKFLYLASINSDMRPDEKQKVVSYLTEYMVRFDPKYYDAEKNHALHHFAQAGYLGIVKDLVVYLEEKVHIDVPNIQGNTILHVAINGHTTAHQEIATFLIEKGADFNAVNKEFQSPLFLAAHSNNIAIFDAVFKATKEKKAFNINARSEQQHTLLFSVYTDKHLSPGFKTHVLNFLLDNGATFNPQEADANGNLLEQLIKRGNFLLCEKIVNQMKNNKSGWQVPHVFNFKNVNNSDNTALHLAAMGKTEDHRKIAKLLLENGASPMIFNRDGLLPLHLSCSEKTVKIFLDYYPEKINTQTASGKTLENLIREREKKSCEEEKILELISDKKPLEEKKRIKASKVFADILAIEKKLLLPQDNETDKLPIISLSQKEKDVFEKILILGQEEYHLIDPASINLNCVDETGMTLLGYAIYKNDECLIKFLLNSHVNPNQKISMRGLPLFLAIRIGNENVVKLLIRYGAKTNVEIDGYTPLHFAAKIDKKGEILAYLISRLGVNCISTLAETPLHTAVKGGNLEAVKILVENKADVIATDAEGNFPLQLAITNKKIEIVKYLVTLDAIDLNQVDVVGNTALHFALQHETSEYFEALCQGKKKIVSKNNAAGESPIIASANRQNYRWVGEKSLAIPHCDISSADQRDFSQIIKKLKGSFLIDFRYIFSKADLVYIPQKEYKAAKEIIEKNVMQEKRLAELKTRLFKAITDQNFDQLIELFSELDQEESRINAELEKTDSSFALIEELENHKNLMMALANSRDPDGNTALHHLSGIVFNLNSSISELFGVSKDNCKDIIQWLLDHGTSLEAKNCKDDSISISKLEKLYFGDLATEIACEDAGLLEAAINIAEAAISFGKESLEASEDKEQATINALKNKPVTAEMYKLFDAAIKKGNVRLTRFLLEKIDKKEIDNLLKQKNQFGDTLLHSALRYSTPNIILLLLKKMSEAKALNAIHEYNKAGQTPLHLAIRRKKDRNRAIISKLLELGVDPDQRTRVFERTPLDIAKEMGVKVQDIVIDAKKKRNEQIQAYTLMFQSIDTENPIISKGSSTHPVLSIYRVGYFLSIHYCDGTPNQEQYYIPDSDENMKKINKIMKGKSDVSVRRNCELNNVRSLWEWIRNYNLPESCWERYETKQAKLLEQAKQTEFNANISQADENGDTLLHVIVKNDDIKLLVRLLENWHVEHELNVKNHFGDSPLHIAARLRNSRMLALLLHYRADFNEKNEEGLSALDLAVQTRDLCTINLLLSYCGSQDEFAQVRFDAKRIADLSGDSSLQNLFNQETSAIEFEEYVELVKQYCQIAPQHRSYNAPIPSVFSQPLPQFATTTVHSDIMRSVMLAKPLTSPSPS